MLTHLSLFSGIGGFDIAAEWAGFKTVCFVEIDPFCQKVLRKHWPDVPLIEDIKDVTKEKVMAYAESAGWTSRSSEGFIGGCGEVEGCGSGNREPTVDLITAGVPCQPISVAGKRRGKADDRWLWPETIRVIREVRPTWVCCENPTGIATILQPASYAEMELKALQSISDCDLRLVNEYKKHSKIQITWQVVQERTMDAIFKELEDAGYEVPRTKSGEPLVPCVPACAVNAPHRRDRVWIVAQSKCKRLEKPRLVKTGVPLRPSKANAGKEPRQEDVADTAGTGLPDRRGASLGEYTGAQPEPNGCRSPFPGIQDGSNGDSLSGWWAVEPNVGRVAHGIPSRVDRLRALGNAVVPAQAYPILKAIADTYSQPQWSRKGVT